MQATHPEYMPEATPAAQATSRFMQLFGWEEVCSEPILLHIEGPTEDTAIQAMVQSDGSVWLQVFEEGDPISDPIKHPGIPSAQAARVHMLAHI